MTREREQTKKQRLRDENKFQLCLKRNPYTHKRNEKNEREREKVRATFERDW